MNVNQRADYYRGLADVTRLQIFDLLSQRNEMSVTALTKKLNLPQPRVSRHLAAMLTFEVVSVRRQGTYRLYRLHEANTLELRSYTSGLLPQIWEAH